MSISQHTHNKQVKHGAKGTRVLPLTLYVIEMMNLFFFISSIMLSVFLGHTFYKGLKKGVFNSYYGEGMEPTWAKEPIGFIFVAFTLVAAFLALIFSAYVHGTKVIEIYFG